MAARSASRSTDPDTELIVGEGVESTFSAMQIFGLAGWSAVYAGGLKTMELPPIVAPHHHRR